MSAKKSPLTGSFFIPLALKKPDRAVFGHSAGGHKECPDGEKIGTDNAENG
jgi:hypothetical protein